MAGVFDERERGYEAKWAHDEEARFKILTKSHAWLAEWAAETMKLPADEVSYYVQAVIEAGLSGKGRESIFSKLRGDFEARHVNCPDSVIQRKMQEALEQARESILKKN